MVHTSASALWFGVVVAGGAVLLAAAWRARDHWDEPGGETFSGLSVAVAGVALYLATVVVLGLLHPESGSGGNLALAGVLQWPSEAYVVLFPVLWSLFAAQRKGLQEYTRRRAVAVTGVLLALMLYLTAMGLASPAPGEPPVGGLLGTVLQALQIFGLLVVFMTPATMLTLGAGLVAYVTYDYEHVSTLRGATLAFGGLAGWFIPLSRTFANTSRSAILFATAVPTVVTAVCFWLAVSRFDVFERSVAAGTIGRDKVVEEMEDAVVVVDDEGEVLDVNPVGRRLFEVDRGEAVGWDVADVLGEPLDELRTADLLELDTLVGVRQFEPRTSVITGAEGTLLGFSVVLRDVTERRTREERLQVLNRVLRHNLRNEVSVISGYAELLDEAGAAVALDQAATEITDTAYELAEIGEKARTIERMMAEPPNGPEPVVLAEVVEQAVDPVCEDHPDCEVATDVPPDLEVAANRNVLVPVLENVVENAAEHNDRPRPHVEVRATKGVDPTTVTITVVDDGPGIPEDEREVLDSGEVTPLEHGSGLGLWIAKWGVTRLGGELSFAATEPRGTIVTIRLPVEGPDSETVDGTAAGLPAD